MSEYTKWLAEIDRLTDESEVIRKRLTVVKRDLEIVSRVVNSILDDYKNPRFMIHVIENHIIVRLKDGPGHIVRIDVSPNSTADTELTIEALSSEMQACLFEWRKNAIELSNARERLKAEKIRRTKGS